MRNTSDLTSTACRNISRTPSVMDRARRQARISNMAVIYLRSWWGVGVALPADSATGDVWLYDSNIEAQEALAAAGWQFEQLADVAGVGGMSAL